MKRPKLFIWTHWRQQEIPKTTLNDGMIDGINIAGYWHDIETSKAVVDANRIADLVAVSSEYNKEVGISVAAGSKAPKWLIEQAREKSELLQFTEVKKDGRGHVYSVELPIPYTNDYLNAYTTFIEKLSQILTQKKLRQHVDLLAISGCNITTCEWRLPQQTPESTGNNEVTDATQIWDNVKYSPHKVINVFNHCRRELVRNFPQSKLVTDLMSDNEFPLIGTDFNINENIFKTCKNTSLPSRYMFKHTSLTHKSSGGFVGQIKSFGFEAIWQTNYTLFTDPKTTDDMFVQAMQNAHRAGVYSIEMQQDVYNRFGKLLPKIFKA